MTEASDSSKTNAAQAPTPSVGPTVESDAAAVSSKTVSSDTAGQHRASAPRLVRCAVITVSDTRTLADDTGGALLVEKLQSAGHEIVAREIIPDDPARMRALVSKLCQRDDVAAILLTGGTGVSRRDQTFETISELLTKTMTGYGELFRMLSYQEIGPAAMLSRAIGGLVGQTVVLSMPGSPKAVRLAMDRLILPELGHLVHEANR